MFGGAPRVNGSVAREGIFPIPRACEWVGLVVCWFGRLPCWRASQACLAGVPYRRALQACLPGQPMKESKPQRTASRSAS